MYRLSAGDAASIYGYDGFRISFVCGGAEESPEEGEKRAGAGHYGENPIV